MLNIDLTNTSELIRFSLALVFTNPPDRDTIIKISMLIRTPKAFGEFLEEHKRKLEEQNAK